MKPVLYLVNNNGDLLAVLRQGTELLGIWRGAALPWACEVLKSLSTACVIDFLCSNQAAADYWDSVTTAKDVTPDFAANAFPTTMYPQPNRCRACGRFINVGRIYCNNCHDCDDDKEPEFGQQGTGTDAIDT